MRLYTSFALIPVILQTKNVYIIRYKLYPTFQILMQSSLWKGPNKSANFPNRVKIWVQILKCSFWRDSSRKRLKIHSVTFEFALICGPYHKNLHPYLDPSVPKFAFIFGPTCYEICTYMWTKYGWQGISATVAHHWGECNFFCL